MGVITSFKWPYKWTTWGYFILLIGNHPSSSHQEGRQGSRPGRSASLNRSQWTHKPDDVWGPELSGWWVSSIFWMFTPIPGGKMIPISLAHIFQLGWNLKPPTGCASGVLCWWMFVYPGTEAKEPGMMYFTSKSGAKESQNLQNHRVVVVLSKLRKMVICCES